MKKILFIAAAALFGLTACTDDYKDWTPQTQPTQPATVSFGDGSVTAAPVIDLNALTEGQTLVQVATIVAPTASNESYAPVYTLNVGEVSYPLTAQGEMVAADLQELIAQTFGRKPVQRQLDATISMWVTNGATAIKTATSGIFQLKAIPQAPVIDSAYYLTGTLNNWNNSDNTYKLTNDGTDPYENPVFTMRIPAPADGSNVEFKMTPESGLGGDWSKCLTAGAEEGRFDYDNKGGNLIITAVPDARYYDVTFNMLDQTWSAVALPPIEQAYYLVGTPNGWDINSTAIAFSNGGGDPYEHPVFSALVPAPADGSGLEFKIAPQSGVGDWNKCLVSADEEGKFNFNNKGGNFVVAAVPSAISYLITLNLMEQTWTVAPVLPMFYMVGGLNGWNEAGARKSILYKEADGQMSYTSKFTAAWDLKLWNKNDVGNWDVAYGSKEDGSHDAAGPLVNSGAGAISSPTAEFYTFTLNLSDMTYTWTKLDNQAPTEYEAMGVIGDFNSWSGDVEMEQVTPHNWYAEATVTDGGLKFRANHGWDINWGADFAVNASNFSTTGVGGGANISVPAGTYDFYLNDITGQFAIVAK